MTSFVGGQVSLTSFGNLAGIGGGSDEIVTSLTVFLPLLLVVVLICCGLNLDLTIFLNEMFDLSTTKLS